MNNYRLGEFHLFSGKGQQAPMPLTGHLPDFYAVFDRLGSLGQTH